MACEPSWGPYRDVVRARMDQAGRLLLDNLLAVKDDVIDYTCSGYCEGGYGGIGSGSGCINNGGCTTGSGTTLCFDQEVYCECDDHVPPCI
jgi:hypothetical protein